MSMEDDTPPKKNSFSIVLDKALIGETSAWEWCPTMDILALVSDESVLNLHRLSWQRLLSITLDAPIASITWRPDGKLLTIAHENGSFSICDVESGNVTAMPLTLHMSSINSVHWYQRTKIADPRGQSYVDYRSDRANLYFSRRGSSDSAPTPPSSNNLSVMVTGDAEGIVALSALGTCNIAHVECAQGHHILEAALSPNMNRLYLVFSGSNASADESWLELHSVDTSLLYTHAEEVKRATDEMDRIFSLLTKLQSEIEELNKAWRSTTTDFEEKIKVFNKHLQDNGSIDPQPVSVMLDYLLTGVVDPAMEMFLVSSLGEQGLRRWSKAVENVCIKLQHTSFESLLPTLEQILFRLSELHGCALWKDRFGAISLNAQLIAEAMQTVGAMCLGVQHMLKDLQNLKAQHYAFFNWLLIAFYRLTDGLLPKKRQELGMVEEDKVASFLENNIRRDTIGWRLQPSSPPHKPSSASSPFPFAASGECSLATGIETLVNIVRQILSAVERGISSSFAYKYQLPILPLASPPSPEESAVLHAYESQADGSVLFAFLIPDPESPMTDSMQHHTLWLMRHQHQEKQNSDLWEVAGIALPSRTMRALGLSFYKSGSIAVLLVPSEGEEAADNPLLEMYDYTNVTWHPFDVAHKKGLPSYFDEQGLVPDIQTASKSRSFANVGEPITLAVGAQRGVAAVLFRPRRVLLLDMEEDEEAEEDEEEEDEEDGEEEGGQEEGEEPNDQEGSDDGDGDDMDRSGMED